MNTKVKLTLAAAVCLAGMAGAAIAAPPQTAGGLAQQVLSQNVRLQNTTVRLPVSSGYGQQQTGGNAIEDGLAKDFSNTASEVGNGVTSQIENCLDPSRLADGIVNAVVNRYTGGKGFGGNMTAQNYQTSVGLDNFNPKSPAWDATTKPVTLPSPPGSQITVNTDLPAQTVTVPTRTPLQPRKPTTTSSVYGSGSGEQR